MCSSTSQDVRPGLLHNHTQRRQAEIEKKKQITDRKNKDVYKPIHVVEAEKREEGLKQTISQENKGFAMLQKMGFKPGESLGKSNTGIKEPIPLPVKSDRTGLGRETLLKEIAERKLQARLRRLKELQASTNVDEYRKRMTQKAESRRDEIDLRKSQRICEEMDSKKEIFVPIEKWFWPPPPEIIKDSDEEDEDEVVEEEDDFELPVAEQLEFLTKYLRETHCYCIWCGAVYDDDKDLRDNCPGVTRDDH